MLLYVGNALCSTRFPTECVIASCGRLLSCQAASNDLPHTELAVAGENASIATYRMGPKRLGCALVIGHCRWLDGARRREYNAVNSTHATCQVNSFDTIPTWMSKPLPIVGGAGNGGNLPLFDGIFVTVIHVMVTKTICILKVLCPCGHFCLPRPGRVSAWPPSHVPRTVRSEPQTR